MPSSIHKLVLASSLLFVSAQAAPLAQNSYEIHERLSALSCPGSNQTTYTVNSDTFEIECGFDRPGNIDMVYTKTFEKCISSCSTTTGCVDVSWVSNGGGPCYMKSSILAPDTSNNAIWGARLLSGTTSSISATSTLTTSTPSKTTTTSSLKTTTTTAALTTSTSTTSTTSSTLKTTTTASTTATTTLGKRGVAYNTASYVTLFTPYPKVDWAYNWDSTPSGTLPSEFLKNYVPMLWSNAAALTSVWADNVATALAAGSEYLLAFNEPDLSTQSDMSPETAASAYKQFLQPYASDAKLGAPAVTNGGAPDGLTWLGEFMGNCTSCTVDFIPLHWYDSATNIAYFQSYIEGAYTEFGKPLWITEFGASGTDAEISLFFETVLPWLDSLDYIERYAYFLAAPGYLLDAAGTGLSDYGITYVST